MKSEIQMSIKAFGKEKIFSNIFSINASTLNNFKMEIYIIISYRKSILPRKGNCRY